MHRTLPVLAVFLATLLPGLASAATFRLGGDESLDCRMTIEGEIVEGDAERFRQMLSDYVLSRLPADISDGNEVYGAMETVRICLDSPGGSISEAIEMADTLAFGYRVHEDIGPRMPEYWLSSLFVWRVGTAVPAGARCESACAILFMAGGDFLDLSVSSNGRDPNRLLHVDGRLGFHAPSLVVPDGDYTEETVSQAFNLAVDAVQAIAARMDRYRISPTLFERLVSTPPSDMFYVDTVGEAASWHIGLAGAPLIEDPSEGNIDWVCRNMRVHATAGPLLEDRYTQDGAPPEIRSQTVALFGSNPRIGLSETYGWRLSVFRDEIVEEKLPQIVDYTGGDCEFSYDTTNGEISFFGYPPGDHGLGPNNSGGLIVGGQPHGWMLFPEVVTLSELSDLSRRYAGRVPGSEILRPVVDSLAGYCALYGSDKRLVEQGTCTAENLSFRRVDLRSHTEQFYVTWPNGDVTELPAEGEYAQRYTGAWERLEEGIDARMPDGIGGFVYSAPRSYAGSPRDNDTVGQCFRNASNGETRCFLLDTFVASTRSILLEE